MTLYVDPDDYYDFEKDGDVLYLIAYEDELGIMRYVDDNEELIEGDIKLYTKEITPYIYLRDYKNAKSHDWYDFNTKYNLLRMLIWDGLDV